MKAAWTIHKVHAAKYRVALATYAPHAHGVRLAQPEASSRCIRPKRTSELACGKLC